MHIYKFFIIRGGVRANSDPIEDSAKPGVMVMQFAIPVTYNNQIIGVLYLFASFTTV